MLLQDILLSQPKMFLNSFDDVNLMGVMNLEAYRFSMVTEIVHCEAAHFRCCTNQVDCPQKYQLGVTISNKWFTCT